MKKLLFALALLPLALNAQQDSTRRHYGNADDRDDTSDTRHRKLFKVVSISAYMGGEFYRDGFQDRTIFQQAAPGSNLAFADLSGYNDQPGFYSNVVGRTGTTAGMNVQLHVRGTPRYSEIRVGVGHSVVNVSSQYYYRQTTTRVDTISMSNGDMLFVDSVSSSNYRFDWYTDVIQLNLGWIVRSDPKRKFNVYTGMGIYGGVGFNGIIEAEHSHASYQRTYSEGQMNNISYTTNFTTEILVRERSRAPMLGSFGVYVPMGFNLRLGRRNNVLRHMTIYGEYNGAVQFILPKGVDPKVSTLSSFSGGLRWYVHAPAPYHRRKDKDRRHEGYKRGDGMVH